MKAITIRGYNQLDKQGVSIDSVIFVKPNPLIYIDNEIQTSITQIIRMTIPKGKMVSKSTLIAISKDKGINWFFLDSGERGLKELKILFPNLSDELIIMPKQKPFVIRE